MRQGFTLIELSIVLVIIGLIVGGVLVGQDLIRASEVRAQISQIEKLNAAVNTFRGKYGGIPGDLRYEVAAEFGFTTGSNCTGTSAGRRDGNGLIDGTSATSGTVIGGISNYEAGLIWQDLSSDIAGNLIDVKVTGISCLMVAISSTALSNYFPSAKLGRGTYIVAYNYTGRNWWGLFGFSSVSAQGFPQSPITPISVMQAYNIDTKMDDGIATTGNIVAQYVNNFSFIVAAPNAAAANSTSCYESTTNTYNISQNNGGGGYCALSFAFQ